MAVIHLRNGNLFEDEEADTFVSTVNCVGVCGAGIALDMKHRFPDVYERYRAQCEAGLWKPGMISLMRAKRGGARILLVSTKDHWKNPSEYPWIETILEKIEERYEKLEINTLAMSHLGCGHGRLDKDRVRRMTDEKLGAALIDVNLYF